MPDSLWWLAQNLNYTKGLKDGVNAASIADAINSDGYYWCVGAASFDSIAKGRPYTNPAASNSSAISGGDTSCRIYGAMYSWLSVARADGIFDSTGVFRVNTAVHSTLRGICPKNWLLPTSWDWGRMLNAVEGCPKYGAGEGRYCLDAPYTADVIHKGPTFFAKLSTALSGRKDIYLTWTADSVVATKTYPAWSWHTKSVNNPEYKKNIKNIPPNDYYGFSMLPVGYKGNIFYEIGKSVEFWLAGAKAPGLYFRNTYSATFYATQGNYGFPVRCLKSEL
jgi:uncharacterized protein (TIGR02145 family)